MLGTIEDLEAPIKLQPNCEVEPPEIWRVNPDVPPPDCTEHVVGDGENWQIIANCPAYKDRVAKFRAAFPKPELLQGMSEEWANAKALVYFNFYTTEPKHINWYLANYTCCFNSTEDNKNRRFSQFDQQKISPRFKRKIARAGKVYIPNRPATPWEPTETPLPTFRGVNMWAAIRYQDGLFKILHDLFVADKKVGGAAGALELMSRGFESIVAGQFNEWTPAQLRRIAKVKRFAKPLLKAFRYLKYTGWASHALDAILGGRCLTGYLVMSYELPADTHFAWEIDLTMKGTNVFGEDEGWFTTAKDRWLINTDVFDPEHQWANGKRLITSTVGGSQFNVTIYDAFKRNPNAYNLHDRAFGGDRYYVPRPGVRDWSFGLQPYQPAAGFGLYRNFTWNAPNLTNGKFRMMSEIMNAVG